MFKEKAGRQVGRDADKGIISLVRGWGHGAKKFSRFVLFFVEAIKISSFFPKTKIKVVPGLFWSKFFRTGFTFALLRS